MRKTEWLTGILGTVFLLTACGDATNPLGPELGPQDASLAHGANPVVEAVSGAAQFSAPDGDLRTFAFTARRHANGSVSGQWERIRRFDGNAGGSKAHGVVTCFTVIDNQVWLGGYATTGNYSEPGNSDVAWRVADNGQGRHAPPDQISLQVVSAAAGYAADFCDTTPAGFPAFFDLVAGNITIR
jgi:hypothetical protein